MAWSLAGNVRGPKGDPAPSQVTGSVSGVASELTLWVGSQAEYDELAEFDPLTVYVVAE